METYVGDLPGQTAGSVPSFDERTFDQAYFTEISNYAGRYERYNPPHKIRGYLRQVLRQKSGGSLIDVGCAFGKFLQAAGQHYRCEGLDISSYALQAARARLAGVPLHHGPIQEFRPGRTFDVVTCFDVLEHIPELDEALASLRGLLAPQGVLALAVPVYDTPPGRFFGIVDRDPTHVHRFGRQTWLARLESAGLDSTAGRICPPDESGAAVVLVGHIRCVCSGSPS
jgi:2-polyprenyl-3-methyl-5-hydroxy-6-metoxy-1,4-benzoquinol methylase